MNAEPPSSTEEPTRLQLKTKRKAVPKAVEEAVLKEFNHRCAICAADKPQLHHIDEDRTNGDRLNLLPLCPNCHLTDQHNPTSKIDPGILRLLRVHKDPTLLTPQFEPLFRRMQFLLVNPDRDPEGAKECRDFDCSANDLVSFISVLEMSAYYARKIRTLLLEQVKPSSFPKRPGDPGERIRIIGPNVGGTPATRKQAIALIVELVRYQPWHSSVPNKRQARES